MQFTKEQVDDVLRGLHLLNYPQPTRFRANNRISSPSEASTTGPSRLSSSDSESETTDVLDCLVEGKGMTEEESTELTEVCGQCKFRFLAGACANTSPCVW